MNVTFTDDSRIRAAAARLLAEELTQEDRESILREVLAKSLVPNMATVGSPKRKSLQELLTDALYFVAQQEAQRLFTSDPEIVAKVHDALRAAMVHFLTYQTEKLSSALATAFINTMNDPD